MKQATETGLVKALLQRLGLVRGVTAWRNNTTGVWDPTRKRFRTLRGRKGVSDILGWIVCRLACSCGSEPVPVARFLAVEAKVPGKRPTPEQEQFLEEVRAGGGIGLLVRSVAEMEEGLRAAGVRS
jgi:hypothetical protein